MFQVLNSHLDYFRFLNAPTTFLQIGRRQQARQVGQAIIHPVSPALLNDPVRHWILITEIIVIFRSQPFIISLGLVYFQVNLGQEGLGKKRKWACSFVMSTKKKVKSTYAHSFLLGIAIVVIIVAHGSKVQVPAATKQQKVSQSVFTQAAEAR